MTARRSTRPALVAAAALALSACGAQQPQPSVLQARTISNALTSIASSCGQAYRRREFAPGDDLRSLETSASSPGSWSHSPPGTSGVSRRSRSEDAPAGGGAFTFEQFSLALGTDDQPVELGVVEARVAV